MQPEQARVDKNIIHIKWECDFKRGDFFLSENTEEKKLFVE